MRKLLPILLLAAVPAFSPAQEINPDLLEKNWAAYWITVPGAAPHDFGVYLFRKKITLQEKPGRFTVHVSADNRYKLFVNGQQVSLGPARNDLYYWNFETIDLASFLQAGENIIAAQVWNEGAYRPEGQISYRTGFLLQGNSRAEEIVNTNTDWKCIRDSSFTPITTGVGYSTYFVAGPGELIDMHRQPMGWSELRFNDAAWLQAGRVGWRGANPKGVGDISGWMLVPASLPPMELRSQRFQALRRSGGIPVPAGYPVQQHAITIPANQQVTLLFDQSYLTNAYPVLRFSKGDQAGILIVYAESLFSEIPNGPGKTFHKGNRDEVEGKFIAGRRDSIISNGKDGQVFTSLDWRTFRYAELKITTRDEPLVLEDFSNMFTGYPFKLNARFESDDRDLERIFEVGWRTARSCAMETYMDCPYYEQLQYIGDTRIQALVSLYNSGDDRLVRNALDQMDHSRIAEGITLSRHPSFSPQQIPTFSLWYIGMLYDYWMYRGDSSFVREKLQGVSDILWFFKKHQVADGSLRRVPYWTFTDWVNSGPNPWSGGNAPLGSDGSSSVLDLQLLWALQLAVQLEEDLGFRPLADQYRADLARLQATIQKNYWDPSKEMYADNNDHKTFSQHANALAILTGTIGGNPAKELAGRIQTDASLAPASIYFKYYLHQAMVKAGLGDQYLDWLGIWKDNLRMGMTTWAEISEIDRSRSDCHAWGASPNIEFFRIVLGIDSDAPGFSKVRITPHPGRLTQASGRMPHPAGVISANYRLTNKTWHIEIDLPATVTGILSWSGKEYPLQSGKNKFDISR